MRAAIVAPSVAMVTFWQRTQAITGPEEREKLFKELSPNFFDLVVVDECHRGSAADDAAWREILESVLAGALSSSSVRTDSAPQHV